MTTQSVLRFFPTSTDDGISLTHEPIPATLPHELLVKIKAVALNGRDVHVLQGSYALPVREGVVGGSDCCGVVVGIGSEVGGFEEGDVSFFFLLFFFSTSRFCFCFSFLFFLSRGEISIYFIYLILNFFREEKRRDKADKGSK